ncbi:MAG: hypothetical protein RL418_465, partial [Actinomycetota bacterium]
MANHVNREKVLLVGIGCTVSDIEQSQKPK